MTSINKSRRVLALLAATTAAGIIAAPIASTAHAQEGPAAASAAGKNTTVTLKVDGCEGCEITLGSLVKGSSVGWSSKAQKVANGTVTFTVPTNRTKGLSVQVFDPNQPDVDFATIAAFRYKGFAPGEKVDFSAATKASKATGCWAGTSQKAVTLKLTVRDVDYGDGIVVPAAWLTTTQKWLGPMVAANHGVISNQDLAPCFNS